MVYEFKDSWEIIFNDPTSYNETKCVVVDKSTMDYKVKDLFTPDESECAKGSGCDCCWYYRECLRAQYEDPYKPVYYELGDFAVDLCEQGKLSQRWLEILFLARGFECKKIAKCWEYVSKKSTECSRIAKEYCGRYGDGYVVVTPEHQKVYYIYISRRKIWNSTVRE